MIKIRPLAPGEEPFLQRMTYHALFKAPGEDPFPMEILEEPAILKYYHDWGRAGDFALVAHEDWELVGAIWCRLFPRHNAGYGFVDENTPELSMAVLPAYRGKGVGTRLLDEFVSTLRTDGCQSLSLSVDERNPATRLYREKGFEVLTTEDNPIMQLRL